MITLNSNGTALSANYGPSVAESSRKFLAKIMMDGEELDCAISRMTITKGSCGTSESFSIGNVISSTLNLDLREVDTVLKGSTLEARIGLYTGSDYEYVTLGHFIATEVEKTAYKTTVVAYGATNAKTTGAITIPATKSLANIASAVGTLTGLYVTLPNGIDTSKVITKDLPTDCTGYQALQILASVIGGFVMDTHNGNITIKQFSDTSTVSVATDRMLKLPEVSEEAFTVSGVKVTVREEAEGEDGQVIPEISYTYGEPVVMYDTNEYMTEDLFNIYKGLVGYSYKYGTIDLSLGDPRIEGNDVMTVTDVNGNTYTVPCHQVTHTYDGGFSTTVIAVKPTSVAEGIITPTPISQRLDTIAMSTYQAQVSAGIALQSAESAKQSAEDAQEYAEDAYEYAEQAYNSLGRIESLATQASESAQQARADASTASAYANSALDQLGVVEDVVGVLELLQTNGQYEVTQDTVPQAGKWYFTRSGTAPNYVYSVVDNPTQIEYVLTSDVAIDPNKIYYTRSGSGTSENPYVYTAVENPVVADIGSYYECIYYELVGISDTIQNYLTSRLSVTGEGLWIQDPSMQTKILLSPTDGVVLKGIDGATVGKYGATAQIGNSASFHIEIDGEELGFYQATNKVAYLRNNQLFINQSVVVQQMDVGLPVGFPDPTTGELGLGQWSWKVHENSENPPRNNLYLKWIG